MKLKLLFLGVALGCHLPGEAAAIHETNLNVVKIWDAAPHNAFTDLIRHSNQWFCVFREGKTHVSPDGVIRVLRSGDGKAWESAAILRGGKADLRDPKISLGPDGRLMLTGAAAFPPPVQTTHQTRVWFSQDGSHWTQPIDIGDPNVWLWRIAWHKGKAYGVGYGTSSKKFVRLYASQDGQRFEPRVSTLFDGGYPNEAALAFGEDDRCYCLLRRDGEAPTAKLGSSLPPYTEWDWKDLAAKIGGPQMLRLPDGRFVAGVRLYDGKVRTSVVWVDPEKGQLTEFAKLPSGGDCSYPGMLWHNEQLWMSYYSSHEGKGSIYLARLDLPPKDR